jgi:hypothetical protein
MSLTIRGLAAVILGAFFPEVEVNEFLDLIVKVLDLSATIGGILTIWYARYRQGDITWYGRRI